MNGKDNPTKNGEETAQVRHALLRACGVAGLDPRGARLVHHYANAVYVLPAHNAVVRLLYGPQGVRLATTSLRITRWLFIDHDFPATAPIPATEPITVDETTTATFWTYYPQPDRDRKPTSAHLGALVRRLHDLPRPPVTLPRWNPLRSLETAVRASSVLDAISSEEQRWLLDHITTIRGELKGFDWPLGWGLIHGDAWAGNVLWNTVAGSNATVLGDWDSVCWGPREIDLVPSFHATRRYGRGPSWAREFVQAYGYDLSSWSGFPTLLAMRDLVQLSGPLRRAPQEPALARALRERLDGIRSGSAATWAEF
ncbi:phosphotransferase [Actinocrispum wychmicini]|uniref:Phosphotransferase family enzyme n=1 Tax=Actinocrispum wychmicini TaxID=1213861 RepID=A0A4R2JZR6_9PSEU|nr:phosphotransferase [Actinocrispum wychmicini]TCO62926.1 phosphotransferase family enzyme [Actinocrispum wychmicini]